MFLLLSDAAVGSSPLELLLAQGPLGLIAGLFVWLYLSERKSHAAAAKEHATTLKTLNAKHADETLTAREHHFIQLDSVRQVQISREQEVATNLQDYGETVVEAIDQATKLVEEIRRLRGPE